jgi:hypothetical protein
MGPEGLKPNYYSIPLRRDKQIFKHSLLFSGVQVYPDSTKRSCPFNEVTCFIQGAADVLHRQLSGNSATAVPVQLFWYFTVQHYHS